MSQRSREDDLARMLAVIQERPGIRASEINRAMCRAHTWNLRSLLLKRGLVRRERDGGTARYYPVD